MVPEKKIRRRLVLLALVTVLCAGASVCLGAVPLSPAAVGRALLGREEGAAGVIVRLVRLPRTGGCLLAGAALAVSGAVIQAVLDNPLASPSVLGVNAGAGFGVTLCCILAPAAPGRTALAAFAGALAAVMTVLFLAGRAGAARLTLVLAGMAVSAIFNALTDGMLVLVPDALAGYTDFRLGGAANLPASRLGPALAVAGPALVLLLALAADLDVLTLGQEQARGLGMHARAAQVLFLTLAAALAGAAVSVVGLVSFVGLLVPHLMRRLLGTESAPLLAGSALGGAALLTGCDLLARLMLAPYEIPVGIVLALTGGPFFLWLLLCRRGGRSL